MSADARLPSARSLAAFGLGAAVLACAAPVVAYAGSLALFGLPHVLAELRYVDYRFGRRIGHGPLLAVLAILLLVVGLRALGLLGVVAPLDAGVAELGLVAVLAFVAVPSLLESPWRAAPALVLGGLLAYGSAAAPLTALVLLAVLHNLTPVGFLLERFRDGSGRRTVAVAAAVLFVLVPVGIATGLPSAALAAVGLDASTATFGTVGASARHTGAFVPSGWFTADTEAQVFAAVTYLQLLHYGAVLLVLPRLVSTSDRPSGLVRWPRARVFVGIVAALGLVAAVGFVRDFAGTRASYGLIASVHAWIEIPVLLLALAPPRTDAAQLTASTT